MKIAAIGDVHGRKIWREIAEDAIKKVDKIVFLGDYVDPYPIDEKYERFNKIKTWNSFVNEKNYIQGEESLSDEEYIKKRYGLTTDWESGDENLSDEEYYNKYYKKNKKINKPEKEKKALDTDNEDLTTIRNEDGDELLNDEEYLLKYYGDLLDKKKVKYIYPPFKQTIAVLEEIIDFKQKNMDKVILIIGNHDAHYLYDEIYYCSRYDNKNSHKYKELYRKHKDLFQYCYQYKNTLFTHAGITNGWVDFFNATLLSFGLKDDFSNIGEVINKMGEHKLSNIIINVASKARGGTSLYGGPTWAHLTETEKDYLKGFHQYVGHTMVNHIYTEKNARIPGSITYCDVLENPSPNIRYNYHIVST